MQSTDYACIYEAMVAAHDEACATEHPTFEQRVWQRLSAYDVQTLAASVVAHIDGYGVSDAS